MAPSPLTCPFCGARETERLQMDGRLVVIFPCMFSPVLDPALSEPELQREVSRFAQEGTGYFQQQCDKLHYFVTKGAGAVLPGSPGASRSSAVPPPKDRS